MESKKGYGQERTNKIPADIDVEISSKVRRYIRGLLEELADTKASLSMLEEQMAKIVDLRKQGAPEILTYLNLVLIDQIRSGKLGSTTEFSKMLKELDLDYGTVNLMLIDGDSNEPLVEIPIFSDWRNLGPLDQFERSNLISKASGMIGVGSRLTSYATFRVRLN